MVETQMSFQGLKPVQVLTHLSFSASMNSWQNSKNYMCDVSKVVFTAVDSAGCLVWDDFGCPHQTMERNMLEWCARGRRAGNLCRVGGWSSQTVCIQKGELCCNLFFHPPSFYSYFISRATSIFILSATIGSIIFYQRAWEQIYGS